MHHLGAGYVAGAIMVFATNPVWMIKTRMQLQDNTAKPGAVRPYAGLVGETPHRSSWFTVYWSVVDGVYFAYTQEVCVRCGCFA